MSQPHSPPVPRRQTPGQGRKNIGPVLLDPHHIVPSAVHYGLAQVPLRIPCVHGQQLQPGTAFKRLAQSFPQHPGFAPFLRCRPLGQAQLQVAGRRVDHHRGIAALVHGLLGPFPVRRDAQLAAGRHTGNPAGQSRLQLLPRDCGQSAGDGGGVGGSSRTNPRGSLRVVRCIRAKRAIWDMAVWPHPEPVEGPAGSAAVWPEGCRTPLALLGSGIWSKHANRDSAAAISTHSLSRFSTFISPPLRLCNRPVYDVLRP